MVSNFNSCLTYQIIYPVNNTYNCVYHSKNTQLKLDPERVHWGQTPFRVSDDPETSQPDVEYDPELGQSEPIICQVCGKLTDFRVILDPEWSLAPI